MPDTLAPSVADVVELTRALVRCESVTPVEAGALVLEELGPPNAIFVAAETKHAGPVAEVDVNAGWPIVV